MRQPFEISAEHWELYGNMLSHISQAELHPTDVGINMTSMLVFSLPREEFATRAQFDALNAMQRRSQWFLDVVGELIVRKTLPSLYLVFADITPREWENCRRFEDHGVSLSKEYCDGSVRFWIHLARISKIVGAELQFFACRR